MKKWFDEEYEFTVEVTGFLRGDHTERYCRNGEEVGDTYTCTYVRSGGDLENVGGDGQYTKTIVCPDGCIIFRLTAKPLGNPNFHRGGFWKEP